MDLGVSDPFNYFWPFTRHPHVCFLSRDFASRKKCRGNVYFFIHLRSGEVAKVKRNKKQLFLSKRYYISGRSQSFQLKFPKRLKHTIFFLHKKIRWKKKRLSSFVFQLLELAICRYPALHKCPIVMCVLKLV